jgi:hypothetical protein
MPPPGQTQRAAQKYIVFEQFEKMNTQSVRQALSEKELAWLENLQPIAPNNLTTVPAPGSQLTTISETIYKQFFANLLLVDYIVSFTTVGGGWATNIATGASVEFAPPGTFTNPDMTVWQSSVIIINDPTAGYSAWNGTLFVRQGGVSMNLILTAGGTGYTSVPTVAITGGSGTGATATATIGTPAVTAVNVINGGSQYGPAPTVVFAGGGGTGAAATANIDPRGVNSLTLTGQGAYNTPAVPTINFVGGGGTGATAGVGGLVQPGGSGFWRVTTIAINTAGSGYSSAPAVVFTGGNTSFGGFQATATCTVSNGRITSITVTSGGGGYTSAPTVSFSGGGSGTGGTAAAVVGGSGVLSLILTNPGSGYLASDVLTLTISGGGGTGATGTAHVWPFVTAGTTLAVFAGRVWLGGNRLLQWSGTQGFEDFNVSNAAGALTIGDVDLQHAITALRNYNNYLFIMGDQSVKQIGSISVSGSATLFTILTLSSDQGTIYPLSCGSFDRVFMFANSNGAYAVLGSSVQKISDDMDGIFKLIDFSQQPQAAIVDINNIHNISWLVRYKDPLATTRSVLLTFNGKKWFVISQGDSLATVVATSTLASGKITTYASSGSDLTPILFDPTIPVTFKAQTALTHHGNAVQRKKINHAAVAVTGPSLGGTLNVEVDTDNGVQLYTPAVVPGFQFIGFGADGSGEYLGLTITGTMAGFTFTNTASDYQEVSRPFAK